MQLKERKEGEEEDLDKVDEEEELKGDNNHRCHFWRPVFVRDSIILKCPIFTSLQPYFILYCNTLYSISR